MGKALSSFTARVARPPANEPSMVTLEIIAAAIDTRPADCEQPHRSLGAERELYSSPQPAQEEKEPIDE